MEYKRKSYIGDINYEELKEELNTLLTSFLDNALIVDSENATSENIEKLKEFNVKALQDVEILRNKINEINLIDLQKQNSAEYEKIVAINEELKKTVVEYNEIVSLEYYMFLYAKNDCFHLSYNVLYIHQEL